MKKNIKNVEKVEEKEKNNNNRKWLVLLLLFLLLMCTLLISITFGKGIYKKVENQIIETFNLDKPSSPVIEGGSREWAKTRTIKVKKDAYTKNGLSYYEYCVNTKNSTKNCDWKKTETKNTVVTITGKYYVVFRAVDTKGNKGNTSNIEEVYIDNNNPVIKNIKIKNKTNTSVTVEVDAKDNESGIDGYYYSVDGVNYSKGKLTYTYSNLEINKEYTIYIKVVDKVGNNTILSMQISTDNMSNTCDLNCDTNGDGKCDLNCDTNGDGKCDLNCDTVPTPNPTPDSTVSPTVSPTPIPSVSPTPTDKPEQDIEVPIINLDKVPASFMYGSKYDLPSYYKFGPSGGSVICTVDGKEEKDTATLVVGKHVIECIAKGNNGINVRVSKQVEVKVVEGEEEDWDGWIRLNLYYPENSTNWQWRLGKEGEIRDGYDYTGWQDYTGPILVKLDDVENIYIRYDLLGETYIIPPKGKVGVDIEPQKYTIKIGEKTKVKIYYDKDSITKEYRVGSGEWQEYKTEFEVGVNTIIEARATKEEKVYNSDGEYQYTKTLTGVDSVYISELIINEAGNTPGTGEGGITPGTNTGSGTIAGGIDGTISYEPVKRADGTTTTKPTDGSKPSTYLVGPMISSNPSTEIVDSVKIKVTPQEEAEEIYIKIGNKNYQKYTEEVEVDVNTLIRAYYIRKSDSKVSEVSYYRVKNIKTGQKPYVKIDSNPDYLSSDQTSVVVTISGSNYDTLKYSFDGIIYQEYTTPITITESSTIYAKGTNSNGETIEKEVITTVVPAKVKEKLTVSIFTNPDRSNQLINHTEISIDYDKRATKKYYKLAGESEYKEYIGPFTINKNTTVYAYAVSSNGVGYTEKGIDFLATGIMAPIITTTPTGKTNVVKVKITYDSNASSKYYQIDGGEKLYYTGELEVYENSKIYAYNSNTLGYEADSNYEINNIIGLPNYLVIDKGKYFIIKLNYPSESKLREYKWKPNGVWKEYDSNGILLIKPEYKDEFDMTGYDGIKVEDANGKEIVFKDHYYLIDVAFSKLMENLFMRWDTTKASAPEININPSEIETNEVEVYINYSKTLVKKYYKIVEDNGTDTGWMEYTGSFKIDNNNSIIYAKGVTFNEVESDVASKKISNIDKEAPTIEALGDFTTPKQKVMVTIKANDNYNVDMVKWAKGKQNKKYFKDSGERVTNPGSFNVEENGIYTIYAVDRVGNETIKEIEISNIDKEAPNIIINVLTEKFGTKAAISIDYGDSVIKEYKIGNTNTYQAYTDKFIIYSEDVYTLKNDDGSLSIYARGGR